MLSYFQSALRRKESTVWYYRMAVIVFTIRSMGRYWTETNWFRNDTNGCSEPKRQYWKRVKFFGRQIDIISTWPEGRDHWCLNTVSEHMNMGYGFLHLEQQSQSKVTSSPRSVFQKRISALNLRGVISREEYEIENHQCVLDRIFFDKKKN